MFGLRSNPLMLMFAQRQCWCRNYYANLLGGCLHDSLRLCDRICFFLFFLLIWGSDKSPNRQTACLAHKSLHFKSCQPGPWGSKQGCLKKELLASSEACFQKLVRGWLSLQNNLMKKGPRTPRNTIEKNSRKP